VTSAGREVATPLRRLSSWAIDCVLFWPIGAAVFGVMYSLWLSIDDLLWDLSDGVHLMVVILFVAATYAVLSLGLLLTLVLTGMNNRQIVVIFAPVSVLFILSVVVYWFTFDGTFIAISIAISSLSACTVWTLVLFGNGQTPGKRLVRIQVVQQNGEYVSWRIMFVRETLKSLLHIFIIGLIIDGVMLLSDKVEYQSAADRIAGTMVVHAID